MCCIHYSEMPTGRSPGPSQPRSGLGKPVGVPPSGAVGLWLFRQMRTSWRRGRWDGGVPLLRKARFPAGTRRSPVVQTEANPGASAPGGWRCPGGTGSRVRLVRRLCTGLPCGRGNDSIIWSLDALCAKAPRRHGRCLAETTVFARPAPSALAEASRTLPPEGGTQADCRQLQTPQRSPESRLAKRTVKTGQRRDSTTGSTHLPEDPDSSADHPQCRICHILPASRRPPGEVRAGGRPSGKAARKEKLAPPLRSLRGRGIAVLPGDGLPEPVASRPQPCSRPDCGRHVAPPRASIQARAARPGLPHFRTSYPQPPAPLRRAWTASLPILAEPESMDKL